ncbi:isochorismatase family cysteine hydrolase [Pseudoalteromonas sp. APC 3358]|uniref:isochorismatase family cysteine hydrolase n=1 Tax=unclassified Pseudoalteromonas TaxID=194690 RepID=UPI0013FD1C8F|nr:MULTISPECIES: isochorismatase family cysteine hydrolase [unclassified Pseudoalteromonas]MBH0016770.1 cysteine hydrolase [Pseudoalteromonas sp. NGC95]MDN3382163.1 isochorismatase family cysteine hydrolase [Pseudoalteromonas sp. APC 3358]
MDDFSKTAPILIGFQNNYFLPKGILYDGVEESSRITGVGKNTLYLLTFCAEQFALVINTPIHFTQNYSELKNPIGILKVIAVGAFKAGSYGVQTIKQIDLFSNIIEVVFGKRSLNAFTHIGLAENIKKHGTTNIILAGTVSSICIDSTVRTAVALGSNATILSDCTPRRTPFEQAFYREKVSLLYVRVCQSNTFIKYWRDHE